jgi:hypothetical protein
MSARFVAACKRFSLAAGLLAAGLATSGALAASGDVIVMQSTLGNLTRGQELADDDQLELKAGDDLMVLVLQNGVVKQIEIKGPRHGKVKELVKPEPLWLKLKNLLIHFAKTGDANEAGTVGSRGARFVLNDVPINGDTTVCLEEGTPAMIAPPSGEKVSVRLTNGQGTRSVNLELAAGSAPIPWPTALPIEDGNLYRVIEPKGPQAAVTIHLVPHDTLANASSGRSLDVLATNNCDQQIVTALQKVRRSK